ncbi:DNA phosphorothioation-dependent restriction protein DptH [Clostridium chromiireducens]|uniref:DNA phosphorothioation-dependent restriction protein DptH n=1 Tax=Clostridium chromiireducens TaxID=225345 RepID=A0A964RNG2_9CLOT|nr:DNA phosphorothioation-dependent restriction protein DptH [Clostridium chromiireducens]MVX64834.1 DNA phosphorothioation-dependent restriction protein DptH [Clostridium chromiireducens]
MLNQFYSYLSEKIMEFFITNPLSAGAKYNIQFEQKDQVQDLYNALRHNNNLCEEFKYKVNINDKEVTYDSYTIRFNDVKLIVAATIGDVQPDFLTRLRNMVGVEKEYKDKAILFIHDTTLDSIMGGTESFIKEGMPFHINSIQKDIQAKMAINNFSEVDKAIISMDLEHKRKELIGDSISIFEYRDLLAIINEKCIQVEEYKNFGLFCDSELKECSGKKLIDRLKDNALNFNRVDEIHNYGNPETQLDRYYDDKGVNELKKPDWKTIDFKHVKKYIEDKIKTPPLEFIGSTVDWDREEGTSKAKSRLRNMIIFNEEKKEEIELEFSFDGFVSKEGLKPEGQLEALTSGKKIRAKLLNCDGNANFYKITYTNDKKIKFEFRVVVVCFNEKYLESIKTSFSISYGKKNSFIRINTNNSFVVFNEFALNALEYKLADNYETVNIAEENNLTVKIGEDFEYENDSDIVTFKGDINNCIVPFEIVGTTDKTVVIEGPTAWKLKREKKCDFKYIGENKLQFGTKDYFTRDEFRKNLQLEKKIIEMKGISFIDYGEGLEIEDLELDQDIREAYFNILNYFDNTHKLPSLAYLSNELKELYYRFISIYKEKLNEIPEGKELTRKHSNLFKIGVIKKEIEDKEMLLTPLHPLNIAYQLHLYNEIGNENLEEDILKKFSSSYLMPYITVDEKRLYIPVEQNHSPEWKCYVDEKLPRYKSSRDFVSKVVYEKIDEFVDHFEYLFNMGNNAPIRINLINTGDSKEILQGIFKYYLNELKDAKTEILPMDIYIYSNKNITNAFEEVAFNDDIKDLKATYGLNLNVASMSEEDILDLYREKVHFYSKKVENGIEYAHITFIEMNNEIVKNTANMDDIPSGIIFNGLISGVPSVFLGEYYKTGFGTKFANTNTDLIQIATRLNAVNAASTGAPFNKNISQVISVPNSNKLTLEDVYNSSHWVTFIDPKVDLNFFKNDPGAKDLLIIHYSDQYTTAGGYDAITVTRKSGPYQKVIEEFLNKKGIENVKEYSAVIINMFNAINGDWLLRLISSNSYFPKEKLSILSAIKLAIAKFKKDNFIWVPISLEEVLRVSGGAGLKQSEGFLSAKKLGFENSGATSDDILLIGIEEVHNKVYVHYYPVEVKIGYKDSDELTKGITQAKATKKIFTELLLAKDRKDVTVTQKVYRNFLMQLVITSAEKLNLYNVCDEMNWNSVIDKDLRRKLLNEEYIISNGTEDSIGTACVISFKAGNKDESASIRKEDNVMVIAMNEEDGFNFVTKTVSEIREVVGAIDFVSDIVSDEITNSIEDDNIIENDDNDPDEDAEIEENNEEVDNQEIEPSNNSNIPEKTELTGELIASTEDSDNSINDKEQAENIAETSSEKEYGSDRDMRILFGVNQKNNREIYWCPNDTNKMMHTNTGIIGTMGTGKTQFTKSMVTQIYKESKYNVDGKKVGILIFDYKGDYNKSKQDFIEATDAKVFELYHLPFNPLSVVKVVNSKPMLPLHTANGLKETLAKAFGLGIKQETLLRDLIMEAYERRGIIKNDQETWDKPAPTLKDVYDIYVSKEDLKEDSLYAAFSNLIDFEIFEPDPNETKSLFDLIDGVTVIDLSGYDPGIQNLVVAITLDLFYSQMQAHGHSKIDGSLRQLNKIVLVDEADNFLSKNFSSLKKILKEGREFGVGTILSTQLLSHFSTSENEYANYILTWVIHNVADLSNKDVRYIFNTQSKQEDDNLFSKIKSLNKHYSLVKMGDSDRALFMKDRAFWELGKNI